MLNKIVLQVLVKVTLLTDSSVTSKRNVFANLKKIANLSSRQLCWFSEPETKPDRVDGTGSWEGNFVEGLTIVIQLHHGNEDSNEGNYQRRVQCMDVEDLSGIARGIARGMGPWYTVWITQGYTPFLSIFIEEKHRITIRTYKTLIIRQYLQVKKKSSEIMSDS